MFRLLAAVNDLHEIIGNFAVLGMAALAIGLGGPRHKIAGAILLLESFSIAILSSLTEGATRLLLQDGKAILVLLAFGIMTVRWPDRWLILLTGLQAFAVMLLLAVWIDPSIVVPVNGLLLNITGWMMLAVLLAATVAHILRTQPSLTA